MGEKNSHCSYCGQQFARGQPWPRKCASCENMSFVNPTPVAACIVPVEGGVLCIRRGIPPHVGKLALPGGYIDLGESWQAACAREVEEETGLVIDPDKVTDFRVRSAPDSTVLVFGCAANVARAELPDFKPTNETTEVVVVDEPIELAFPLHSDALTAWFHSQRG